VGRTTVLERRNTASLTEFSKHLHPRGIRNRALARKRNEDMGLRRATVRRSNLSKDMVDLSRVTVLSNRDIRNSKVIAALSLHMEARNLARW
jgi:hypothetical protein